MSFFFFFTVDFNFIFFIHWSISWFTGKPSMLQSMGSQRVRHNLTTEQQIDLQYCVNFCYNKVIQLYIHIFFFIFFFIMVYHRILNVWLAKKFLWVFSEPSYTKIWMNFLANQFPVLYRRTLLFILYIVICIC